MSKLVFYFARYLCCFLGMIFFYCLQSFIVSHVENFTLMFISVDTMISLMPAPYRCHRVSKYDLPFIEIPAIGEIIRQNLLTADCSP